MNFGGILNTASGGMLGGIFGTPMSPLKPPTQMQQAEKFDPNAQSQTDAASRYVTNMQAGLLSPDVMRSIENAGATWGVNMGMPGSGAATDVSLESLGLSSMQAQEQGFNDYMKFLGFGSTMEDPSGMQAQLALQNDVFAHAPDPILSGINNEIMQMGGIAMGAML